MVHQSLSRTLVPTLCLLASPVEAQITATFPGATWETRTPAEVGMDAAGLAAFSGRVGGRGVVVRYGYLVHSWGNVATRSDVASACKPLYTHFLLHAVEQGLLGSVNDLVAVHEPRLNDLNPDLSYKDRDISWRHLANQISGYGVGEAPGTAFDYSDWNMALLFDSLFLNVYGSTWSGVDDAVLAPLLTDRLQCQDDPTFMVFGTGDRPGRVGISVRDFARFGLLYLNRGNWDGQQLLLPAHVDMVTGSSLTNDIPRTTDQTAEMIADQRSIGGGNDQTDHMGSYSFAWWTNGVDRSGHRHWPNVPLDAYGALGHGGPRSVVVIPSEHLVVSWNDAAIDGASQEDEVLGMLVDAVVEDVSSGPAPGQVVVDPSNPAWFARHQEGPFYMCGPGDPEGFLYGTNQDAAINYLATTGANAIYVMAVRSHDGDGDATQNPFVNHDPAQGLDADVLDQWDAWFNALDAAGIVTFFVVYDDGADIWDTTHMEAAERDFIDALVDRFKHHKHWIWCVAEEYGETLSTARASEIAARIRDQDDRQHPIAIHQNNGTSFNFNGDPSLDQFAVQYNQSSYQALHSGALAAVNNVGGLKNVNLSEWSNAGTGLTLRRKIWSIAMAGAYTMPFYAINDGDMRAALDGTDAEWRACGRLVEFMESTALSQLGPDDSLVTSGAAYCLAARGSELVCYLPGGGSVTLDLTSWSGALDGEWFHPVTGARQPTGSLNGGGQASLSAPDSNDWALRIVTGSGGNRPPSVSLTADPGSGVVPLTVQLHAHTADPDGDPLNHDWDLDGDGSYETAGGPSPQFETSFLLAGSHLVGVEVTDGTHTVTDQVTVVAGSGDELQISDPAVASGRAYEWGTLAVGELVYIDRTYTFTDIAALNGQRYLRTANDDKGATEDPFITFTVDRAVQVLVGYDGSPVAWLASWTDDGNALLTTDKTLHLYRRNFPAGAVQLGPNAGGGNSSMYSVVVIPEGAPNVAPVALPGSSETRSGIPVYCQLQHQDDDGPGPFTFTIVDGPAHGDLTGSNNDRYYTSLTDYDGSDSFTWKVNDGLADSSEVVYSIQVLAPGTDAGHPDSSVDVQTDRIIEDQRAADRADDRATSLDLEDQDTGGTMDAPPDLTAPDRPAGDRTSTADHQTSPDRSRTDRSGSADAALPDQVRLDTGSADARTADRSSTLDGSAAWFDAPAGGDPDVKIGQGCGCRSIGRDRSLPLVTVAMLLLVWSRRRGSLRR